MKNSMMSGTSHNEGWKLLEFNLPSELFDRMKKLSKIRGHSINDEFLEAIYSHLKEKKAIDSSPKDDDIASIEEQFAKDPELRKTLDKVSAEAVRKHLKKHEAF